MAELKKRKLKQQQNKDARKAQRGKALSQKSQKAQEEDDDDGSGGGPGKRKQNGFKLEKLLGAIAEGRQKAKGFWRALAKEGLDISETKKSVLGKQKEKSSKIGNKLEQAEQAEKAKDKALEAAKDSESGIGEKDHQPEKTDKSDPVWEKARAADHATNRGFGFEKAASSLNAVRNGEAAAKALGTIFSKQEQIAGAHNVQVAAQTSADRHGARVQGAQHAQHQDYHGTMQFNHSGKNGSEFAFSKGVKQGAASAAKATSQGPKEAASQAKTTIRSRG